MRTQFSTKQLIEQWLSEQDINQASRKTYDRVFHAFHKWIINEGISIRSIGTNHIIKYKEYLIQNKSTKTANLYLTIVKRFFKFCELHKIHDNVTFGVKNPRQQKQFSRAPLQPDQVTTLLNAIPRDNIQNLRNYAIINLMVRSGLRAIEVCRMDRCDLIKVKQTYTLKVQGKGMQYKTQQIPISNKSLAPIFDYLLQRSDVQDNDPLFARHNRNKTTKRLTPNFISRMIKQYLRSIGMDGKEYTGHSLRHTFAYNLIKSGADIFKVQLQLRHTSPLTTQLYLRQIEKEAQLTNEVCAEIDKLY